MSKCSVRAVVTGKVQGVSFRQATQEKALAMRVTGYAKNLPDGRVEVLLCGESEAVNTVAQWLWQGPPEARVTHVEVERLPWQDKDSFLLY
ncbi:acylphosphatase [Halomonas shantousis]